MIGVRQAVEAAVSYVRDFQDLIPPREMRLEETESLDSGDWQVTLSFLENPISGQRSYKSFLVDKHTGEIKSMKVRSVTAARLVG